MITLYLDMDGVLCNFDKAYRAIDPDKADRKKFREAVFMHKIFEDLEFMHDAHELLNFVAKLENNSSHAKQLIATTPLYE